MPKTKKQILPKNLLSYEVLITETSGKSEYFNVTGLPEKFTGGKNSFLIDGSSYLRPNSKILIEVLDTNGRTIYSTPIKRHLEGTSALVSVEIYATTPRGFATIVVMGELNNTLDGQPIPSDWQNTFNVRWTTQIMVEPRLRSVSPIRFLNEPSIGLLEEKRFFTVSTSSFDEIDALFTASLSPILRSAKHVGYLINASTPTSFSAAYINSSITGSVIVDGVSGSIELFIENVLNDTTMLAPRSLITLNDGRTIRNMELRSGSYTSLVFGPSPSIVTSSAVIRYGTLTVDNTNIPESYAKIRVVNLNTVSGEIYKVRVYNKVSTNIADYKLVADVPISSENLLVSESIRGTVDIGDFYTYPTASNSWYSDQLTISDSIIYSVSGSPSYYDSAQSAITPFDIYVSDDVLLRSIFANVPVVNNKFGGSVSESGYFIGNVQPITVFANTEYTLKMDAYYRNESGSTNISGKAPKVDIYIVGTDNSLVVSPDPLGQLIGQLTPQNDVGANRFESIQINFRPSVVNSANVGLRFVVSNGFWNFSNISLKPASDYLYGPDEILLTIPNVEYHNALLEYKVEFFDINNNSTGVQVVSTPTFFTGSNIDLGTLP